MANKDNQSVLKEAQLTPIADTKGYEVSFVIHLGSIAEKNTKSSMRRRVRLHLSSMGKI
jgi:hypothetical protein